MNMLLLLALALGVFTGLRAFTPLALVCWAAFLDWMRLAGTPLAFLGALAVVIVVSVLALGELVNDKLPRTGNRTAAGPFVSRIILAGLCGTALFLATRHSWIMGAAAGAVGAPIGTFGGFHLRRATVKSAKVPDFAIALVEDAVAIGGAFFVVSHLF